MTEYDPKSIIDKSEHGDPFETMQEGIDTLLSMAKNKGYQAMINAISEISGTTRYAVNQVTQHTDINNITFNLKLSQGKKVASASSTLLGKKGYEELFNQVEGNLLRTPEIPFYQGLPEPQSGETMDLSGEEWTMEDRADAIVEAVNSAETVTDDFRLAGTASSHISYYHIVSTEGADVETSTMYNYYKVNAITGPPDGRGYGQEELYWRFDHPDVEEMTREAVQTAVDTVDTKLMTKEAGKYEVVLGPQAVNDLMVYVLFGADAVGFHESNSYTTDRLGDQIFDEKLTIRDLPQDPHEATLNRCFDGEGIATKNQVFYDQGVLKFIPYSSFMAAKYLDDRNQATGHLLGPEMGWFGGNAMPVSTAIDAGTRTTEQQISEIEDGLYIKNFWYNRFTKRREGGLTGLTRNGVYYVQNGEIQGAVRNLRYTDSFVRAFGQDNIVSLSSNRRKFFLSHVPSIHLKTYQFSSVAHTNQAIE